MLAKYRMFACLLCGVALPSIAAAQQSTGAADSSISPVAQEATPIKGAGSRQPEAQEPSPAAGSAGEQETPVAVATPDGPVSNQEVIVTGSRISRRDFKADSPIVTLGRESLDIVGAAPLEQVFNAVPQFSAMRSATGATSANLRGLGTARTLVLLDGRRLQPSNVVGTIDLNTIPDALIENIEVITGGASATYGSDAIAGVANFKLRTRFTGVEFGGTAGLSDKGDIGSQDLYVVGGTSFAEDRGRIVAGLQYLHRDFTPRGNRDFFIGRGTSTILTGGTIQPNAANLPTQAGINAVFARYGFTGNVPRNSVLAVNADGTVFNTVAVPASGVPIINFKYGTDSPYLILDGARVVNRGMEYSALQAQMEKYTSYIHAEYDLTEGLTLYSQFLGVHYSTVGTSNGTTSRLAAPILPVTNPFITPDLLAILRTRPNPNAPIDYLFRQSRIGNVTTKVENALYQALLGIKGKLPVRDWTYDLYGTYGHTKQTTYVSTNILTSAIQALITAPDGGRGICPGGFNPFGVVPLADDPSTRACYDYVNRPSVATMDFSQSIVEGTVQGSLFTLPYGDLKFAAGGQYRRNSFATDPGPGARQALFVTADVGGAVPVLPRGGNDHVKEVFGELLVPVLKDILFFKDLSVDVAGRISDYKSVGTVKTYKGSLDWQVFQPIQLRGSYQRAIRAPNLDELNPTRVAAGGQNIGTIAAGAGDPCDVNSVYRRGAQASQVRAFCIATGVPASVIDTFTFSGGLVSTVQPLTAPLKAERGDTFSYGAVLSSPFAHPLLSGLQLSVDYYNIKVKDAIGFLTVPVTVSLCFNANGSSNPSYAVDNIFCQQISRDASGAISEIRTPRLNLASYSSTGIDTQLDWRVPLSGFGMPENFGSVALNVLVSYMGTYRIQNFVGDVSTNYAGSIGNAQIDSLSISHPDWKAQGSVTWNVGDISTTFRARYVGKMFDSLDASSTTRTRAGVPARTFYDLNASVRLAEGFRLRASVLNLFDTAPPIFANTDGTDIGVYDVLGRRFTIGLSKKF